MKAQMSVFAKVLFIVAASIAFVLVIMYNNSFRKSTTEERELSNFKMETMNVLQKLVNDKSCLAYVYNETPQKSVIDVKKLEFFVSNYSETEPECAKALDFDYNIKVKQFQKEFTLYPGETCREQEALVDFLCTTHNSGGQFIYVSCNYKPSDCQGVCQSCGEFDNGMYSCETSWGCGDDPLKNCPYTGSCDTRNCPYGQPPNGICCIYKLCSVDACDKVIGTSVPEDSGDNPCWLPVGKCDLSKCSDIPRMSFCAHCTRGIIEVCLPSNELININIPMQTLGFGVGFGASGFSPNKARVSELQLSLPVTIRYNETFSAEGIIYIYAVKGELESLYSLIEDFCEKVATSSASMQFSKQFHFSLPVDYSNGKLCMTDSCKILKCSYPVDFDNISEEGDYDITFSFNPTEGKISVRK